MRNETLNGDGNDRRESPIDGEMIKWARAAANRAIAPFDRRPGCAGDAEDVAQEILVSMLIAARSYAPSRGPFVRYFAPHMKRFARRAARKIGRESGPSGQPFRSPERATISFDAPSRLTSWKTGEKESPLSETLAGETADPADATDARARLRSIADAMDLLDSRSRRVLELRLAGSSLQQVSDEIGVCRERVRQIEMAAIDKIAETLGQPTSDRPTISGRNVPARRPRKDAALRG